MSTHSDIGKPDFHSLDPNSFLKTIEDVFGKKLTSFCQPYPSYINRVFELQTSEEDERFVAKFYRPGRWKKETLKDEHEFLLELDESELPVVAPLRLKDGSTLGSSNGIYFALFPKKGGRTTDELSDEGWLEVGRLLGRVHNVGATHPASSRITWSPGEITKSQVQYIVDGGFLSDSIASEYQKITQEFIDLSVPAFIDIPMLRIHADFHFANLICRLDEPFQMIDFDDMAMGPAVQDMWMLLSGYRSEMEREIGLLAEGYEAFRDFPYSELKLIEILRGMRYIHFSAWCAHQINDDDFKTNNPNWGSEQYWREEINELKEQLVRVRSELSLFS